MNRRRVSKVRSKLEALRRAGVATRADLERLARKLGWERYERGKEPTYIRTTDPFPQSPLSIPGHPGDLKKGTALSIIDFLLDDCDLQEAFADEFDSEAGDIEGDDED